MVEKRPRAAGRAPSTRLPSRTRCSRSTARSKSWRSSRRRTGCRSARSPSARGLAPSTAYRMLTTLAVTAWSSSTVPTSSGRSASRPTAWARRSCARRKLVDRARSVMQQLMESTGETANLGVAEDDCVVFVSQVETHQAIRAFFRPGTPQPVPCIGHRQGDPCASQRRARRGDRRQDRAASLHRQDACAEAELSADLGQDPRARLVDRRRGALSRHALRGGGDLQRVRRAGRRHLDLRPDGACDAAAPGGDRAGGEGGAAAVTRMIGGVAPAEHHQG